MEDAPQQDPLETELIAMIRGWNAGERSEVAEPSRLSSTVGAIQDAEAEEPTHPSQVNATPHRPTAPRPPRMAPARKSVSEAYPRFLFAVLFAVYIWYLVGHGFGPHRLLPDMWGAIATFLVTATALQLATLLAEHRRSFGMRLILRLVAMTAGILCVTLLLEAVYNP